MATLSNAQLLQLEQSVRGMLAGPWPLAAAETARTPAFPSKLFAPYYDVSDTSVAWKACPAPVITLAFVLADGAGKPAWNGTAPLKSKVALVNAMRAAGKEVIVSLGGQTGTELAQAIKNVDKLAAAYTSVVDTLGVGWVDFDIEGASTADAAAVTRRHKAIAKLQKARPGVVVSFTLPVMPDGLPPNEVAFLRSAKQNGVRVDVVNVMAMDYSDSMTGDMAKYAISAATATRAQVQQAGLAGAKIGITPMIGQNDIKTEVFTLANARTLADFARRTDWVRWLGFWSINRDNKSNRPAELYRSSAIKQDDWAFSRIFAAGLGKTRAAADETTATGGDPAARAATCAGRNKWWSDAQQKCMVEAQCTKRGGTMSAGRCDGMNHYAECAGRTKWWSEAQQKCLLEAMCTKRGGTMSAGRCDGITDAPPAATEPPAEPADSPPSTDQAAVCARRNKWWSEARQKCMAEAMCTKSGGTMNAGRCDGGADTPGKQPPPDTPGKQPPADTPGKQPPAPSGTGSWKKATATYYNSYPECCTNKKVDQSECEDYSGCEYQGMFAAFDDKKSKDWVKKNNIVAFYQPPNDANRKTWPSKWKGKRLEIRNPKTNKVMQVTVADTCDDGDCDGCCTENSKKYGSLIDLEYYTAKRFYGNKVEGKATVEWRVLS